MTHSAEVGIGVIGANSFVANAAVIPAIDASARCRLSAAASRSGEMPTAVQQVQVGDYQAVIDHPDVDAVYIPLPNGLHELWVERCAAAGKHVLCEKPLACDAAAGRRMAAACADAGVLLAEAYMTPFHDRYAHVIGLAERGDIGEIRAVDARFTFTIGADADDNYRWDPASGGGSLLDVGIYCLEPIIGLLGGDPATISAKARWTSRGVDASMSAVLEWPSGTRGHLTCSFVDDERQQLAIEGTGGRLLIEHDAFTGGPRGEAFLVERNGVTETGSTPANDPYLGMIDAFADAITGGSPWARPIERSVEMLSLIERIREVAA